MHLIFIFFFYGKAVWWHSSRSVLNSNHTGIESSMEKFCWEEMMRACEGMFLSGVSTRRRCGLLFELDNDVWRDMEGILLTC